MKINGKNYYMTDHHEAERFDHVTVEIVDRWKESELSGDEWRYAYCAYFWKHGTIQASVGGHSINHALLQAAAQFNTVTIAELDADNPDYKAFREQEEQFCSHPGCGDLWVYLMHPINAYDDRGGKLEYPYDSLAVRGFCEKHRHRGDCGLDDSDDNYELVATRDEDYSNDKT